MGSSPETAIMVWLFAAPTLLLLWAAGRSYFRMRRGQETAHLRKLEPAEIAAGVAALAAAFGVYY